MELYQAMKVPCIQVHSEASSKNAVLTDIARLAKQAPCLSSVDEAELLSLFQKREEVGSTGFEDGIAIPHCRLESINEFVVGVVTLKKGIDFGAMDGGTSDLFFFVIGPEGDRSAYVRMLSAISRSMLEKGMKKRVMSATTPSELQSLFSHHSASPLVDMTTTCSFQIIVQNEEYFSDILQVVSSLTDGVDVIETRGAGHYLHRLPIFSTFWTDDERLFHRIIIGVIRRDLVNELARGINVTCGGLDETEGVLISVQDCLFCQGKLLS